MRVWTVSQEKAGTLTQCLGVAQKLDPKPLSKTCRIQAAWRGWLPSPYRSTRLPEPDVVISCGRHAEQPALTIKKAYGGRPTAVHLLAPRLGEANFDLAFVSRHDWTEAMDFLPNYHKMVGVPHRVDAELLAVRRDGARLRYLPDPSRPAATVLVGGTNNAFIFDEAVTSGLLAALRDLAAQGWTLLVSTSRRSEPALLAKLLEVRSERIVVWDRTGDNPFLDFLAAADAFLITQDTITMTCESLATGKPVHIFPLTPGPSEGKYEKFLRFHKDMSVDLGLTRPFDGALADYSYVPLDETDRIAKAIEAHRLGYVRDRAVPRNAQWRAAS